jgi:hypothetical protein
LLAFKAALAGEELPGSSGPDYDGEFSIDGNLQALSHNFPRSNLKYGVIEGKIGHNSQPIAVALAPPSSGSYNYSLKAHRSGNLLHLIV